MVSLGYKPCYRVYNHGSVPVTSPAAHPRGDGDSWGVLGYEMHMENIFGYGGGWGDNHEDHVLFQYVVDGHVFFHNYFFANRTKQQMGGERRQTQVHNRSYPRFGRFLNE